MPFQRFKILDFRFKIFPAWRKSEDGSRKANHQGFTLVEVLVAVGIISIITAIAIPNLRNFNDTQSLQAVRGDIKTAIIKAQANAITGTKCPNGNPATSWLVAVTSTSYTVSATCSSGSYTGATITLPLGTTMTTSCPSDTLNLKFMGNIVQMYCTAASTTYLPTSTITVGSLNNLPLTINNLGVISN